MTREEFIKELDASNYSYEIVGDKLVVTHGGGVNLGSLKTLPSDVEFRNEGYVDLSLLRTLPSDVKFNNRDGVGLNSLRTLPSGVKFNNKVYVSLASLNSLPSDVEFKNVLHVSLNSLIGSSFNEWQGNIEGIGNNTLLNLMIKKSLFV